MASNHTSRAFRLIWNNPVSQQAILSEALEMVAARATRRDVDVWLGRLEEHMPGMALILRGFGVDPDQVEWKRVTDFLCDCFYAIQDRSPLPDPPSDEEWDRNEGEAGAPALYPQRGRIIRRSVPLYLLPLEQLLLERAKECGCRAERMVYRGEEWDLVQLLARGEVFTGPAEMREGEPGQAHANVARLWADHQAEFAIATGYALSEDGLWRQHSFAVRKQPKPNQPPLVETTVPRVLYFGYTLTQEESERFHQVQVGE
jgi:hypothetical protein